MYLYFTFLKVFSITFDIFSWCFLASVLEQFYYHPQQAEAWGAF